HLPDLLLVGSTVAADGLLDRRGRVLSARDAGGRRGDEHGAPGLPDGECDAGVGADVRLLQRDDIRRVAGDQLPDAGEDREQASLRALAGSRAPPPVARGPEAPVAFVDDPVSACRRPWVDAENLHGETLGATPDVPAPAPTWSTVRNSRTRFKNRTWFGPAMRGRCSTRRTRFASFALGASRRRPRARARGCRSSRTRPARRRCPRARR